ncbi:hypothetical protein pdam_00012220 [Pocillopora damicornis]|uniref:Peptidase M12B domain-containing protein n=1 Tax=Pocillopora damicornis TaxID=46731 RepID=A0A3M6UGV9_POCDA|nr:hypothetical protein pdam_00012220 [Pocillopora damicornis]
MATGRASDSALDKPLSDERREILKRVKRDFARDMDANESCKCDLPADDSPEKVCDGLSELGTICQAPRSCSLAEDNGLSTAYTIAHELGHLFSLPHDGDNNLCTRSRGDQHLMAPSLSFDTKPWSWSSCSREKITRFLELGYGSCLENKPNEKNQSKYHGTLPGEMYSVDKQCQLTFGEESRVCPYKTPVVRQDDWEKKRLLHPSHAMGRWNAVRKKEAVTYLPCNRLCFRLGYGSCLENKPSEKNQSKYHGALPGEIYSVDKQCQMIFGEESRLCPYMEPCRRLWCVKMIGKRKGCSTHHMPWADGTPCAKRKRIYSNIFKFANLDVDDS